MKSFIFASFVILSMDITVTPFNRSLCDQDVDQIKFRIVGGREAVPNQFPYQVAVIVNGTEGRQFCGGSIISDEYILTAAHCLDQITNVTVVLGAHNISANESTKKHFKIKDYVVHPEWGPDSLAGDIALLRVPEKIVFTCAIRPIRLPKYSDKGRNLYGRHVIVSGWGRTSDTSKEISPVLRFINSKIITNFWCKVAFIGLPTSNHVCISGWSSQSICGGDSGGPLATVEKSRELTLRGVASFGFGLGCTLYWPSVFTRVSPYLDWIYSHTGIIIYD